MDDFIKRSDALKVIETANSMVSRLLESTMKLCVAMDRIAAADVVPVVHGRWKPYDLTWGRSVYACTACEEAFDVPTEMGKPIYAYCPNCGALMDKDGDGDVPNV